METASSSSNGESKPVCQCATKSGDQRWLPGFPIALCLLMSLSSVTVCLLMSFRTQRLENRLYMEMDKASILQAPQRSFKYEDGTLLAELSAPVGKLVEEKVAALMPKLRTARDVGQECSCPPAEGVVYHLLTGGGGGRCPMDGVIAGRKMKLAGASGVYQDREHQRTTVGCFKSETEGRHLRPRCSLEQKQEQETEVENQAQRRDWGTEVLCRLTLAPNLSLRQRRSEALRRSA